MVLSRAYRRSTGVRPTTGDIAVLTDAAERRLDRLSAHARQITPPVTPDDRRLIAYIVIEAANLWASYGRCLFLSCALGATDSNGRQIVPAPAATLDDALTLAVHAVHPNLRGTQQWKYNLLPDFQNKGELGKAIRYIQAVVLPDVDLALGYQSRVLADLPTMRNYFAHKAERAASSARGLAPRYGLSRSLAPEDLLCSVPRTTMGDILLREWLADLNAILGLMP